MRTSGIFVALVLVGCTTRSGGASVSELAAAQLRVNASPEGLVAYFDQAGSDCTILAADVEATLDGQAVVIDRGHQDTSIEGKAQCYPGKLSISTGTLATAPDALLDLRVHDASGELHAALVGPFAPRALTWVTPADQVLVPGNRVQLAWTPATDTLQPDAGSREVTLVFYAASATNENWGSEVLGATPSGTPPTSYSYAYRWTTLAIQSGTLSFVVPNVLEHGALDGWLQTEVTAQVDACGFASCTVVTTGDPPLTATL